VKKKNFLTLFQSLKKRKTDAQIEASFTAFYLAQATKEFESDLDALRKSDGFRDEHLSVLVEALKQGTSLFGIEEKRRVVEAGEAGEGA
jgi:ribosome assembly protein 3